MLRFKRIDKRYRKMLSRAKLIFRLCAIWFIVEFDKSKMFIQLNRKRKIGEKN